MIRFNIIIRLLLVTKMKKAVILLILIFAFSFVVAENNDEPQLIVNIHPYCYGDDVNIIVVAENPDSPDEHPELIENATVLIKHFGIVIDKGYTDENGIYKYKFPVANIYGIKAVKEEYGDYYENKAILRSCFLPEWVEPEKEPYIHVPPVVDPPEPGSWEWMRVVILNRFIKMS